MKQAIQLFIIAIYFASGASSWLYIDCNPDIWENKYKLHQGIIIKKMEANYLEIDFDDGHRRRFLVDEDTYNRCKFGDSIKYKLIDISIFNIFLLIFAIIFAAVIFALVILCLCWAAYKLT